LVVREDWIPTDPGGGKCVIEVDGAPIACDMEHPDKTGVRILNEGARRLLETLPEMRYIPLSENSLLPYRFEFRLTDTPEMKGPLTQEALLRDRPDRLKTEEMLMKLAGLPAQCRYIPGTPKPWEQPVGNHPRDIVVQDIRRRFDALSAELTKRLRSIWIDPPNLTVKLKLGGGNDATTQRQQHDSYSAEFEIVDAHGLEHFGTGLRWILTFLIEVMDIERSQDRAILLFDEPANHLHPSAQKQLVEHLNQVAEDRQLIYATHSPFLIDWRFPYRIRVLRNNWDGQGTQIDNRPYVRGCSEEDTVIWDEVRGSVGVTFGDIGIVGENNILVEGVSDQVLISSLSARLQRDQRPCLNLRNTSVIPFGGVRERLRLFLSIIKREQRRAVVVVDSDGSGEEYAQEALAFQIPVIRVGEVAGGTGEERTLEDLIDTATYVDAVNRYYEQLGPIVPWFSSIAPANLEQRTGASNPLIRRLNQLFANFGSNESSRPHGVNKTGVAISLGQLIDAGEIAVESLTGLCQLIERLQQVSFLGESESLTPTQHHDE